MLALLGSQKERQKKGVENQFDKIMTKKFPNLKKKPNIPIQKDRVPSKRNPNRLKSKNIIIRIETVKRENSKDSKEKTVTYKELHEAIN